MFKNTRLYRGFTLIELMIAIVILAIIASVALPSYQESVRKTRRADAKAALMQAAAMQERFFTENNAYTGNIGLIGGAVSPDQNYDIAVSVACPGGGAGTCFRLTATPRGAQAGDGKCTEFSLDETGAKGYVGTGTANDCW